MALGDVAMIEPGICKAGLYTHSDILFWLDELHGTLLCTTRAGRRRREESHECEGD